MNHVNCTLGLVAQLSGSPTLRANYLHCLEAFTVERVVRERRSHPRDSSASATYDCFEINASFHGSAGSFAE